MAGNKKGKSTDLGFGDLEDSFFASGDFGWEEEAKAEAAAGVSEPAPDPLSAELPVVEEPPAFDPLTSEQPTSPLPDALDDDPLALNEPMESQSQDTENDAALLASAPDPAEYDDRSDDLPTESVSTTTLLSAEERALSAADEADGPASSAAEYPEAEPEPGISGDASEAPSEVDDEGEDDEYDDDEYEEYEDDDEAVVTAEDFVDSAPDETMILRRSSSAAIGDDFSQDEVARARAEREARRQLSSAEPEPDVADAADAGDEAPIEAADGATAPVIEETSRVSAPPAMPVIQVPSPPILSDFIEDDETEVEPSPPTVTIPPAEPAPRPPAPEPVVAPAASVERVARYIPSPSAAGRWNELARALELESESTTDPTQRARLQAEAGRLYFSRLGNWDEAGRLFSSAVDAGLDEPRILKAYGDVVASQANYSLLRDLLVQRADRSEGPAAAEALQDAVLVERNILRQDASAIALLGRSLEIEPHDWFALRLQRDLEHRSKNWAGLVDVLERMAKMTGGARAARLLVERGRIYEDELDNLDAAAASYGAARQHDPAYGAAFLSCERIARVRGDSEGLISLYIQEAGRSEGRDASFWLARAARFSTRSEGTSERTADLYTQAIAAAGPAARELRHEAQGFFAAASMSDALVQSLGEEAEHLSGQEKAFVLYRLGQILEQHDQNEEALTAYRQAVEADAAAGPAVESVTRLLTSRGEHREMLDFLAEYVTRLDDPHLSVTTLYRMGELCEGPLGDQDGARTHFEAILDTAPGYLPALEGLERVYTRLEAWDSLAAVYEQRALLCEEPSGIALQLHRAGAVCEFRLSEHARARDFYHRALEQVADFPPSLDAFARILESEGDWAQLAQVLSAAAKVTRDSNEVVSLTYRAARILADLVDDPARAVASLDRCLELQPGFLPAITLLRELSARTGAWQEVYTLHRLEAESAEDLYRRHWRMIAAADVAERVEEVDVDAVLTDILSEDERHVGALVALERRALSGDDSAHLLAIYQRLLGLADDGAERVRIATRIASLARDEGDTVAAMQAVSEIISAEEDGPVIAVARIAESLNYWEEARRALESSDGTALELARLLESYGGEPAQCAAAWRSILEEDVDSTEAASGLERALTRMGSREGLAEVHGVLADNLTDAPIAAFHALLAGHLFEAGEELERAISYYSAAFTSRPYPGKAFSALRRIYAQQGNTQDLNTLFDSLSEADSIERAEAIEEAGDSSAAAEVYTRLLAAADPGDIAERLPLMIRLEQALEESGQWSELFSLLTQRKESTSHPEAKLAIESKRRWVLTEELSDTDEAWDFYRQLHEESPQDVEVLEALARIAGARGETDLAIQYLDGLSQAATSPEDAARYQRRVAEVHLRTDDRAAARKALEYALDLHSEDVDALSQLKTLATEDEDWRGLVGVLSREAASAPGQAQVDCYRQIAALWENQLDKPAIAQETWGRVFELSPGDPEALQHLVDLARGGEDWVTFAEKGAQLVQILEGAERSAFMAELGSVLLHKLERESDALRYLDAASSSEHPSLAAARELKQVYKQRGAWEQVVEIMIREAQATDEPAEATTILLHAAEARLDTLHDRDGAAEIYGMILKIKPDNPEALRFRGDYLYQSGDLEGAVVIFRQLEDIDEDLDLDDFDVCIEAAQYYFRFGDSLRRVGDTAEALSRYEKALEFNHSHLPTLEAIGPIYIDNESWDKAAKTFRQILQLTGGQGDPERIARTYTNLGIIEHNLGKLDKAKKRFNKALELRPNDIAALQGIAGVLFVRNDWNNLLNVYNNIIYHAQEPGEVVEAYLTKGYVLDAQLGLPAKAAQHYEKSLDFDPAQPAAYLRLSELALRDQDWPEAAGLADRGLSLEIENTSLLSGLHLVKAIAHQACADATAAQDSYRAAVDASSALAEALGVSVTTAEEMHGWLRERLKSRP